MAITIIGKAILATITGIAVIAPTTYFTVTTVKSNTSLKDFDSMLKNCRTLIINKTEKEKIVICGSSGVINSPLTFYLPKDNIAPKTFEETDLKKISTLSWRQKGTEEPKVFEMHVTLENSQDNPKVIVGDGSEDQPKQNIERIETVSQLQNGYLNFKDIEIQWETHNFDFSLPLTK